MNRRAAMAIAAVLLTLLAAPALAGTQSVRVGDNYFARPGGETLHLRSGVSLRWVWSGHRPHNVSVLSGPAHFASATQTSGSYSHRFTRSGTYVLFCTVHGRRMSMRVIVN